jgi:hypothetical protein
VSHHLPYSIIGFHSCDKKVGIRVLNGLDELRPSNNPWDWLGPGIYFWEQNPVRALEYAKESVQGKQINKVRIKEPLVLGAIVELGNCLNLVEARSLEVLKSVHTVLRNMMLQTGARMPENKGNNRALDCTVILVLHQLLKYAGLPAYDTIRCAFPEGGEIYPGSAITSRLHIQVCVLQPECILGYFLPKPIHYYNPDLQAA